MTWLGQRPGDGWMAAPGGAPRGTLAESDEDTAKIFQWDNVRRLFAYLLPHKGHALLGVAAMVVLQGVNLVQPLLEGAAIDRVVAGDFSGLIALSGIYLATLFVGWVAQYHQVYQMTWAGQHVLYQIASDMFNHIVRLSLSFFDRNETGRIMSRVQSDVTLLQQILSSGLIGTLGNLVSMIGVIVTMFVVNWKLALLSTAVIPLFIIGMWIWQGYARISFRRARAAVSEVSASLQENVSGVRVIQSLGREDENYAAFERANRANLKASIVATQVGSITQPMVEIMSGLGLALVIFFGGGMVIEGALSIGLLYAFTRYVVRFFEPIRQLTQEYSQLQRAAVAAERIFEVLDTQQEVKESEHAIALPATAGEMGRPALTRPSQNSGRPLSEGEATTVSNSLSPLGEGGGEGTSPSHMTEARVTYDHVDFSYDPGVEVLHDFTLDVAPGERVAFVGQTGAGKSTLISLLMRFYDVIDGRIMVDGHDIRDLTLDSLRKQIGIVLQDPVLFAGTIADNIRYARPDASDAEVEAAARAVGADNMIGRLERGYATPVHERGVGLSIGERQLIAFARALFANPRVLVLDEATANLDTRTEGIVQRGIHQLMGGRTSLIIAHRLSTIRDCDRIVVMEQGRIVEMGDHQELLDRGGLYHRLYSLGFQTGIPDGGAVTAPQLLS